MPDRFPCFLEPVRFPELAWESGAWPKSLETLFRYAVGEAERAMVWYDRKRRRAQRAGRTLRLGAILATSAAGVTPLLSELFERDGHPAIDPLWAAFLLAAAGILVLLDRFWGCTSAWVRYVLAGQELAIALDSFRIDWEHYKLGWNERGDDVDAARAMLDRCRSFLVQVRAVVRQETDAWAAEFQRVLEQIEGSTHGRRTESPATPAEARDVPRPPDARG